jgi:hypothetical protein
MSEKTITGLEQGKYLICAEGSQDPCRSDTSMDKVLDSKDRILFANEDAPSGNGPMVFNMNFPVTVRDFISSHRFASLGSPMDRLAIVKTFAKKHDHLTKVDPSLVREAKVFQGLWENPDKIGACQESKADASKTIEYLNQMHMRPYPYQEVQIRYIANENARQCAKGLGIEDHLISSALDVYDPTFGLGDQFGAAMKAIDLFFSW